MTFDLKYLLMIITQIYGDLIIWLKATYTAAPGW